VNAFKNAYDQYTAGRMDTWAHSCRSINLQVTTYKLLMNALMLTMTIPVSGLF